MSLIESMIGRIIGNYRITSELAHGGMGTVYRGQHVHLPREVVVKSILLSAFSPAAQSHLKARFRREAYIQSQLDHPNIVRVYEFFAAEDNYYLVMEYVAGMTLRDLLSKQGVPTPAQAVYLCKQALSALDYAHNFTYVDESDIRHTGIIHRDIKPANMLLDNKGKLKITDFGIVKVMGEQSTGAGMTQTGFHPGTVEYMSPEQLLGLDIDVRSDLYSLGVTFYEMLCGRLPFERSATGSDWEVRKGHIEKDPPPILELRPDVPLTLAAIIMRSLQKSPNERFQTAAEFLEAIQIHERTVDNEQATRGNLSRLTKPLSPPMTAADEDVTLVARPSTSNAFSPSSTAMPPSSGSAASPLEDAVTMPISQSRASNSGGVAVGASGQPSLYDSIPIGERSVTVNHPASSKRKLMLAAAGAGLLLAGAAAGAYLFSNRQSPDNLPTAAVKIEPTSTLTPTPALTIAPTPSPRGTLKPKPSPTPQRINSVEAAPADPPANKANAVNLLTQAKALEDEEKYAEALAKYREYQRSNPNAPESSLVISKIAGISNALRLFSQAQADMEAQRYFAAREKYKILLRMKPSSKIAQAGFEEVRTKIADSPMPPTGRRPMPQNNEDQIPRGPRNRRPNMRHPNQPDTPNQQP